MPLLRQGQNWSSALKVFDRQKMWLGLAVLAAAAVYGLAFAPKCSGPDDARYVTLAYSLFRGYGYRLVTAQGMPPEPHYPPGFPALLVPVLAFSPQFPDNLPWLQLVPVAFALLSVVSVYFLLLAAGVGTRLALFASFFGTVCFFQLLPTSQVLLSEPAYIFCSSLALWGLVRSQRSEAGGRGRRWLFLAAAGAAAAYYVRTVGIVLLVAGLLHLLRNRSFRQAFFFLIIVALLVAPWMLRSAGIGESPLAQDYWQLFFLKDWWHLEGGTIEGPGDLLARVLGNLWSHATDSLARIFFPMATLPEAWLSRWLAARGLPSVYPALGLLCALLIGGGFTRRLVRSGALETYVVVYMGLILLTPWREVRNIVPVVPFLTVYLALGARSVARRLVSWRSSWRRAAGLAVPLLLGIVLAANFISSRHLFTTGMRYRLQGLHYRPEVASMSEAAAWLANHTAPTDLVFYWASPEKVYLYAGRQTLPQFADSLAISMNQPGRADLILDDIRQGIDYVLASDGAPSLGLSPGFLTPEFRVEPQTFRFAYRTRHLPSFTIYRVVRPALSEPGPEQSHVEEDDK